LTSVVVGAVEEMWRSDDGRKFFCILLPSCIERTDVGKLINKSLGNVEAPLCIQRLLEGKGDVLLDHTQTVYQYTSMHTLHVCVCACIHFLPALQTTTS